MKNVTVETRLTIHLTADQWQLYSSKNGIEAIAAYINTEVQNALNEAKTPGDAYRNACKVLRPYSEYGACDSEPLGMLEKLIALRFPTHNDRDDWR